MGSIASPNPITCGRRNCAACGRWKLAIEFYWRWEHKRVQIDGKVRRATERYKNPAIDNICAECRRAREKARYEALPPEVKKLSIDRTNRAHKKRRERWVTEIRFARMAHDARRKQFEDDESVDITPFRMWLVGMIRRHGSNTRVAEIAKVDEKRIRIWADGYEWFAGHEEPTPVRSVRLSTVDQISIALDDVGLLNRLYPYVEDEEVA